MNFKELDFKGSYLVNFETYEDIRGSFFRNYCKKEIKRVTNFDLVQANLSINHTKFTLRGFHYQKFPYWEDKIITCVQGEIHNIVIDMREDSKTYRKWESFRLSEENRLGLLVPKGCANAYLTLKKKTWVLQEEHLSAC